jgi:hypothetical protein
MKHYLPHCFEKLKKLMEKFALGTLKEYASDFGPDHKKYIVEV